MLLVPFIAFVGLRPRPVLVIAVLLRRLRGGLGRRGRRRSHRPDRVDAAPTACHAPARARPAVPAARQPDEGRDRPPAGEHPGAPSTWSGSSTTGSQAHHGIDRASQPERATALLGPSAQHVRRTTARPSKPIPASCTTSSTRIEASDRAPPPRPTHLVTRDVRPRRQHPRARAILDEVEPGRRRQARRPRARAERRSSPADTSCSRTSRASARRWPRGRSRRRSGWSSPRAQFTPDLLPGDLTGSFIYDQRAGEFAFRKGPLFTGLLLADEINRTPPKTQSALLEAMQERQITVEGETFVLARAVRRARDRQPGRVRRHLPACPRLSSTGSSCGSASATRRRTRRTRCCGAGWRANGRNRPSTRSPTPPTLARDAGARSRRSPSTTAISRYCVDLARGHADASARPGRRVAARRTRPAARRARLAVDPRPRLRGPGGREGGGPPGARPSADAEARALDDRGDRRTRRRHASSASVADAVGARTGLTSSTGSEPHPWSSAGGPPGRTSGRWSLAVAGPLFAVAFHRPDVLVASTPLVIVAVWSVSPGRRGLTCDQQARPALAAGGRGDDAALRGDSSRHPGGQASPTRGARFVQTGPGDGRHASSVVDRRRESPTVEVIVARPRGGAHHGLGPGTLGASSSLGGLPVGSAAARGQLDLEVLPAAPVFDAAAPDAASAGHRRHRPVRASRRRQRVREHPTVPARRPAAPHPLAVLAAVADAERHRRRTPTTTARSSSSSTPPTTSVSAEESTAAPSTLDARCGPRPRCASTTSAEATGSACSIVGAPAPSIVPPRRASRTCGGCWRPWPDHAGRRGRRPETPTRACASTPARIVIICSPLISPIDHAARAQPGARGLTLVVIDTMPVDIVATCATTSDRRRRCWPGGSGCCERRWTPGRSRGRRPGRGVARPGQPRPGPARRHPTGAGTTDGTAMRAPSWLEEFTDRLRMLGPFAVSTRMVAPTAALVSWVTAGAVGGFERISRRPRWS